MATTKQLQRGQGGFAFDAPPAGHELGGVRPRVRSCADVATAVAAISWMCSRRATVQARLEQQINLLRETAKADLQLELDGQSVTFDERQQALEAAVSTYVAEHAADVFEGDTKTAKFPSGSVALKAKPAWIQFDEGVNAKGVLDKLLSEHELIAKACAWLKRQRLLPWLRVKLELDVSGITRAIKAQEITAENLREHGMRFEGAEVVVITPADYAAAADGAVAATNGGRH